MNRDDTGTGDQRLIERGFPCHQVGAETNRERDTGKQPPTSRLHVWWARRPLTPSRAAILASLEPADADPERFVRRLGIEKREALVDGVPWTLTGKLVEQVEERDGREMLPVDEKVLRALKQEDKSRSESRSQIADLKSGDPQMAHDPVLVRWAEESQALPFPWPQVGDALEVRRAMGDPAWAKERIAWETAQGIRTSLDKYGYGRAFTNDESPIETNSIIVLDPTAGGGAIPFEALRLGHTVIANELNPVATTILYATLDYPARFGADLANDIEAWGQKLRREMLDQIEDLFPASPVSDEELNALKQKLYRCAELIPQYSEEILDGFIYCRQVTCPHCGGDAPLLNTCWLSKEAGDPWGVRIVPDGKPRNGAVRFETYRVDRGKGPRGEDPNSATVNRGIGQCVHCHQAIDGDEIKAQARGESPRGRWKDRLYAVVAVRLEPKLDRDGKPQRFASGERKGEIKTRKVRFFRPPNEWDLKALTLAEERLQEKWPEWERQGLIPTEKVPAGQKTREPHNYGMTRWCDMFTPRQLLGHLTLVEGLNRLKPQILEALGEEKGRAVVTYLQFAIDKGVDYNSRQTRWEYTRGIVKGTFGRHDFSLKWTFGEMVFTGPNSGAAWGLSQILDAYQGIASLVAPVHERYLHSGDLPLKILHGTAAHLMGVPGSSVDLICMDPPYYDNVQYGELSDYFYHWQKRTLKDLYPDLFMRSLGVNTRDEAVANPSRDGSAKKAKATYERMMGAIFAECSRVLKDEGIMTVMFTHKSLDAWETLTRSLIENGWIITASIPVESEFSDSMHQMDMAAAASSIFLSCRKRAQAESFPASWTGFGGGVQRKIEAAVRQGLEEFRPLRLNPVDEMVACYGRALHVLSEQWPVMDGDEPVSPVRAMNEASRVVAENQVERITQGQITVAELDPETAMSLTLYGIYGFQEMAYDEALNLSRSLSISLQGKPAGYRVEGRMIGINQEAGGRRTRTRQADENAAGYYAPLVRQGSRLRLVRPEERHPRRLENPQTDWDLLHGTIQAYRRGDAPVARAYLEEKAADRTRRILSLIQVWAAEMETPELRREAETMLFDLR